MDWIGRLMEFTPYWAKEESQMTKEEREVSDKQKFTYIGHIEDKKEGGRYKAWQGFIESCKRIADYVKLSQTEVEQSSIESYIQYKELTNREIEEHNKRVKQSTQ